MKIETLIVHGPCIFSAFAISIFTWVEIAPQFLITQPFKVKKAEKYDGVVTTHSFHGSVELSYKFLVLPPLI